MRVLRLVASGDYAVDFHPYVTVVTGLSDAQRESVRAAFRAAVKGRTTGVGGLLEVHDVLLDLDERTLGLLDLADVAVDIVVQPDDLPGAASSDVGRKQRAAARRLEALESTVEERADALRRAEERAEVARAAVAERQAEIETHADGDGPDGDAELARLEAALTEAEEAVHGLSEPGSQAAGELERAERELADAQTAADDDELAERAASRQALEARRAECVEALDPDAVADFEQALARSQELEDERERAEHEADDDAAAEVPAEDDIDGAGAGSEGEPDPVVDVAARIEEIRGALALQASFDPADVRAALDALRLNPSAGQLVPSTEAVQLAERLGQLERRVVALEDRSDELPDPVATERVAGRLEEIRAEIRAAEQGVTPSDIAANVSALEAAHAEVIEAREALDGRFGKARAQQRYEAAVAAEETLLDVLGIRSYTDFMTGGRASIYANAEPEELRRLRAEERELELELRDLAAREQRAEELATAEQERREARGQARTMLDDPGIEDDDLIRALYALRVPAEDTTPAGDLAEALEAVGLAVRALDLAPEDLEVIAADWLEAYDRAADRRALLEEELGRLEELAGDADETSSDPVDDPPAGDESDEDPPDEDPPAGQESPGQEASGDIAERAAEAHAAVRAAQTRMIAHETAARELDDLATELDQLEEVEREVEARRQRLDAAERAASDARQRVEALDAGREAAEAEDELPAARRALEEAETARDEGAAEVATLTAALGELAGTPAPVEEIEWYLLARLAAQRQVSFAGSVPMLIDDALTTVDDEGLVHLLDRLERMAGAVQVVHLTDDERVAQWARTLGDDRAAVVGPAGDGDEVSVH